MRFSRMIKNIFMFLLFLQIAPVLVTNIVRQYTHYLEPGAKVGLVIIKDAVYDAAPYIKQLKALFKNSEVRAILIKMDCPGSASGTGNTIFSEIIALKEEYQKPIVTVTENICASGGYLIASATDYIVAPPMALVGSIGTCFSAIFQLKEFLEKHNVGYKGLHAGSYKTVTDPFAVMTKDHEQYLQGILDDSYDQFVALVAKARRLSIDKKTEWADGKIFTGSQAFTLGLIDKLGTPHDAIAYIKEKTLITTEDIEWVREARPRPLIQRILYPDVDEMAEYSYIDSLVLYVKELLGVGISTKLQL